MTEQRFNYPKHPLFGIAPLLFNWRGDARHDEYTAHLVGRIRAGRYTPELFDANSLYLGSPSLAALQAPRIAVKSRYTMTDEERRAWKNSYGDPASDALRGANKAKREARAAERAAWEAEQKRVRLEADAEQEQKKVEREAREREWLEETAQRSARSVIRERERERILRSRWECQTCRTASAIQLYQDGYLLRCRDCGRNAFGDHEKMAKITASAA